MKINLTKPILKYSWVFFVLFLPSYALGASSAGAFSLQNTDFVVLLSFLFFIGILIYFGVPGIIAKFLDKRAEGIELEINEAGKILEDAKILEQLGCFALVLEKIPAALAKKIAGAVKIPVIGIGAGGDVDGQVLVLHDMLGLTTEFSPRFLRRYMDLYNQMTTAIKQYVKDIKSRDFPNKDEQY